MAYAAGAPLRRFTDSSHGVVRRARSFAGERPGRARDRARASGERGGGREHGGLAAAGGLGIVLSGSVPGLFGAAAASASGIHGYGPLVADPAGILSLPAGYSYTIVAQSGVTKLVSGQLTPDDPDGTACFPAKSGKGSVLVNNHEIGSDEPNPVPLIDGFVYDASARGGTTNIEVDRDGRRVREYVSLAGTHNNCAGGVTPWKTWITCEETEAILAKRHGYCFEVDPYGQDANRDPQPIKCLGRFAHESIVVDPERQAIYLTEDAGSPNGLLLRWTQPRSARKLGRGRLRELADDAGTLQALKAFTKEGAFVPDLSVAVEPGTRYRATWVDVPDRDATTTPVASSSPTSRAAASSRACGGATTGRTSSPPSPARRTAAPPSTTGRCGSWIRAVARSS